MIGQVLEEPVRLRFKKPCKRCLELFRPTGKATEVCENCKLKERQERKKKK
jgi:hypothetical protein